MIKKLHPVGKLLQMPQRFTVDFLSGPSNDKIFGAPRQRKAEYRSGLFQTSFVALDDQQEHFSHSLSAASVHKLLKYRQS